MALTAMYMLHRVLHKDIDTRIPGGATNIKIKYHGKWYKQKELKKLWSIKGNKITHRPNYKVIKHPKNIRRLHVLKGLAKIYKYGDRIDNVYEITKFIFKKVDTYSKSHHYFNRGRHKLYKVYKELEYLRSHSKRYSSSYNNWTTQIIRIGQSFQQNYNMSIKEYEHSRANSRDRHYYTHQDIRAVSKRVARIKRMFRIKGDWYYAKTYNKYHHHSEYIARIDRAKKYTHKRHHKKLNKMLLYHQRKQMEYAVALRMV